MIKLIKVKKGKSGIKIVSPFKNLNEEADFWDTHSVVDKIDKSTKVGFHRANKTDTITIRFQPEHLQELKKEAFEKGVGPTTLARMWILDKMKEHRHSA